MITYRKKKVREITFFSNDEDEIALYNGLYSCYLYIASIFPHDEAFKERKLLQKC